MKTETRKDSNGKTIRVSIESGHLVEFTSESNYLFRLSEFKDKLRDYLKNNVVAPKKYEEILCSQIDCLTDLSVSRESSRIFWGISVFNNKEKIISFKDIQIRTL